MIEPLADKPVDQSIDKWLQDVSQSTVANPRLNEKWEYLDGRLALKVTNRVTESGEAESTYFINGSKTFVIRVSNTRKAAFYAMYRQMLSTFRF